MFSRIFSSLSQITSGNTVVTSPAGLPAGFFSPAGRTELSSSPLRKSLIRRLWENSVLPAPLYERLQLEPLLCLLEQTQNIPADSNGRWSYSGSYGDLSLQFIDFVMRLAKGYTFPPGAAPEEQSAQNMVWNMVLFLVALFHHLPLCARFEGEMASGVSWQPGLSVPEQPYRFRFQSCTDERADSVATLIAGQLLSHETVLWLSGTPAALNNVASAVRYRLPEMALIRQLLTKAADMVESPLRSGTTEINPSPVPLSVGVPEKTASGTSAGSEPQEEETFVLAPALSGESGVSDTPPVPQQPESAQAVSDELPGGSDEDTDELLSLFTGGAGHDERNKTLPAEDEAAPLLTIAAEAAPGAKEIPAVSRTAPQKNKSAPEYISENINNSEGHDFMSWLKERLSSGDIPLSEPGGKIHLVAGYLFLPVPGIFFEYLKATGCDGDERERIQHSFEKLNIHKRHNSRRFYFAEIYESPDKQGKFRREKGYLIKGKIIFNNTVPDDSPYISVV